MLWQPLNLTQICPADSQLTICSSFGYLYLDLLVRLFGDSKDRRIQEKLGIEDRDDKILENIERWKKREEYDFIVVGAGSAGCVVANRLSAIKKWKVLLLEAGPEQPDVTLVPSLWMTLIGSNIDWGYFVEPDEGSCLARPGGRCYWARGKMMGGTSSINGLVYLRGNRADYDGWAALGNDGWSYKEVLPFFKKSEKNLDPGLSRKYHGVDGKLTVSRLPYLDEPSKMLINAINEQGLPIIDVNAETQDGVMHTQATSKGGEKMSTNRAFIQPIRYKRKNLTVRVKSEVIKILINKNNVAYGVRYVKNGKVYTACSKKEVIVCGGVVNSPKLLMLSGIGPKEHLSKLKILVKKDLAVGENLQDHVSFGGLPLTFSNKSATLVTPEEILDALEDYSEMKQKRGPLAGNGPVTTSGFLRSDPKLPAPDVQIHFFGVVLQEYLMNTIAYDSFQSLFPTAFYDGIVLVPILVAPNSRGKVMLNATNPNAHPLIYANYFKDPSDVLPIVKVTVNFLLKLEKTKAFKSKGARFVRSPMPACKDYSWGSEEYFACLARSHTMPLYHPVGTCKMGPKQDKKAVVDPRLRVYGISGLRVIDASVMPVVPRANTNAAAIMVAERGIAFVLEDWLRKC